MNKTTWKRVKLGEVAEINPLESIKKNTLAKKVSMDNLEPFNKKIYSFSMESFKGGSKFKNGDTLLARITPCLENGKTAFVDFLENNEIAFGSTEFIILREKENISDKHFLYYLARSENFRETAIKSMTGSSGRERVQIEVIRDYEFSLPPLETQHKIAEILSSLDDKIDLLHRQNKTLESLSLTLFRHTFIDNPKRNAWEEATLNDICLKIASGGTPSTRIKEYYSGKINWYSTKELDDNFLFDSIQTITEDGLENSSAKLFPKDTIIIAIYAAPTVGRLGILTQDSAFNQAACGLIIDETKCSKEFVFCFLKNERENLNLLASGSAQQNLNVEKIKRYTLLLPDKATFHNFQIQAKGFFDKIYNNSKQIQNLESLRDIMLPKLLSGEMEV